MYDITLPIASRAPTFLSCSFSQRKMLISYSVRVCKGKYVCWGGGEPRKINVCEHGPPHMRHFLSHLCSNTTQNEDLPQIIIYPLPFRPALRNFKGSLWRKLLRNHRNHIACESANVGGVLRWPKQQASDCFISYQWFSFVNEKFIGNCIILNSDYHKERDASDIPVQ